MAVGEVMGPGSDGEGEMESSNCHLFSAKRESSVFIWKIRLVGINACEER